MTRLRTSLIALELSGSLALLVACGLMIESTFNLMRTAEAKGLPPIQRTVIGVVRDVKQTYDDNDANDIYLPYAHWSLLG